MLRAWNTQVGISKEAMAKEAEHLRMEMSKQCIGKTNSKDEERRYYKWVIFCSWKLYHRRILIARRRAQRRAKFKGAIAKALVIPGLSKGASVSTLGVGAAGVNATRPDHTRRPRASTRAPPTRSAAAPPAAFVNP